ncbi:hypothetical protein ASG54_02325 [Aureimonas sp. Leaf460]|nr:hypothetical protein ASG62_05060 [Aureimonas sp. Leaf427]KQT81541.1 hypothetical protein ASG54_02325 [Aureimonas sp. Leaf460]
MHATAIRLGALGILIRGPARSGKSSLALAALRRAEAAGLAAALVADDQVFLESDGGSLVALAPAATRGLIEVSGVGILKEAFVERAAIGLVVDLLEPGAVERLPERATIPVEGVETARIQLERREASLGADILVSLAKRSGNTDLNQF